MSEDHEIPMVPSNKLRHYKNMLRRVGEQVFVDDAEDPGIGMNLHIILAPDSSKYDRTTAATHLVSNLLPEKIKDRLSRRLGYTQDELPIDPRKYLLTRKIGSGGVNDVFLLQHQKEEDKESTQYSYVIKVMILSMSEPDTDRMVAMASQQKKDFDYIAGKFEHIPGLVPPEYFIVAHGPRNGRPAVIAIQPYMGGEIRDVFAEGFKQELKELVDRNENARDQIREFVKVVRNNPDLIDNELDLLGEGNLAIVGEEGNERLMLLDAHPKLKHGRSDEKKQEISDRIKYLEDLVS